MERPIAALNSVWLEELTWIEVRDALTEGKKTVTIPTGGIEQNGPYVALGKHNYVLQTACGFEHIIYIGDSGGNQRGMEAVATALNAKWGETVAHYIPEFYDNEGLTGYMAGELGIVEGESEGYHDSYWLTAMQMVTDPATVRYEQRVAAGKASINGHGIAPMEETIEVGRRLHRFRVERTVAAIREAIGY